MAFDKLLALADERKNDGMSVFSDPDAITAAYQQVSLHVANEIYSRLNKAGVTTEIETERSERVQTSTKHDNLEYVAPNGSRHRFIQISTSERSPAIIELSNEKLMKRLIEQITDELWEQLKNQVFDNKLIYLTPPKFWFQPRASKMLVACWTVVASADPE